MFSWDRQKFTILFMICCIVYSTESRYRDKDRKRPEKSDRLFSEPAQASTREQISLCSRRRDMKLMCYCTPDDFPQIPVTKAECWIFQTGLYQNDTTWQRFYQQKKLRHLKFLVQNTGYLDYIPTKYLEMLTNLTSFSIEYSQIQVVKGYAFASLPNLELITLTNNLIEIIDKDAFANHIYLRELNLMRNQVTEMDRYAFRNLPLLQKLYLSWNNISNLHEQIFSELGKLEDLSLEHNLISVLTGDMFKGLGNLKTLKLTHNNLNFIGDTVFAELWSLQELELDDNRIERISERALDGLNNLKTLNLRNNVLKKLDNGLLRGTPALLSINLQENLLETLTYYNFQPIMDNLVNSTSELAVSASFLLSRRGISTQKHGPSSRIARRVKKLHPPCSVPDYMHPPTTTSPKPTNLGLRRLEHYQHQRTDINHNEEQNIAENQDNNFICDCRLQWIFDLRNRTRNINLKESLEEIVCTLYDNKTNSKIQKGVLNTENNDVLMSNTIRDRPTGGSGGGIRSGTRQHRQQNRRHHQEDEQGLDLYPHQQQQSRSKQESHSTSTGNANEFGNRNRASSLGGQPSEPGREYYVDEAPFVFDNDADDTGDDDDDDFGTDNAIGGVHRSRQQPLAKQASQNDARGVGRVVELLKLKVESLPCPEELSDPTELPLSRESIGLDVRGTHTANNCRQQFNSWSWAVTLVPSIAISFLLGSIDTRLRS